MQVLSNIATTVKGWGNLFGSSYTLNNLGNGFFELVNGNICESMIDQLKGAKVLYLNSSEITNDALMDLEALEGVEVIVDYGASNITIDGLRTISEMGNLQTWGLWIDETAHVSITGGAIAALDLTRCKDFTAVSFAPMTDADVNQILSKAQFEEFSIVFCDNVTSAGLRNIGKQASLEHLWLAGIEDFTDEKMQWIGSCSRLKSLSLWMMPITDKSFDSIAKLKELVALDLYYCPQLTNKGLQKLNVLSNLQSISWEGCPQITYNVVVSVLNS